MPLYVSMQFVLPVLETDCEISWPLGPPKKIEVISEPLMLIESGHRTKEAILVFCETESRDRVRGVAALPLPAV